MTIPNQLSQLENAQLLRRVGEEESTYVFRHALVQETAYQSLLKQTRKHLHRVVGEVLEQAYPEQLDENAAVLALHFAEAGERDKAIGYARRAARRSLARYAVEEAVRQLETAIALADPDLDGETYLALIEEAGDANRLLRNGERTLALYQQAIDLWSHREGADRWNLMRLHRKIIQAAIDVKWATGLDFMRRLNQIGSASLVVLETELKSIQDAPPQAETARDLSALSLGAWRLQPQPDWEAAEHFAQAAVVMAEQLSNSEILSQALEALGNVYDGRGRLHEHLQVALRRFAITQEPGFDDPREKIDALRGAGMAHMFLGEYVQALPLLNEAENLAKGIQAIELQALATGLQAQCLFRLDRWDQVLEVETKWRVLERDYPRERVGVT